jgi:ParB family chromosome partitioning protein
VGKPQAKRGLGRGLSALIPEMPDQEAFNDATFEIEIDKIQPNAYQPRRYFDEKKLAELMESIREHGVVQPVIVRNAEDGLFELIVGERRLRACQRLGYDRIPAIVRDLPDDIEMMEIALIENIQREDLNPVEEARAYQRLSAEFGLTQEEIAGKVSKSRSLVANMMRLLNLPEPVLDLLAAGELTIGHVRPLLSLEPEQAVSLANRVKTEALSVRETEELVRGLAEAPAPALEPPKKKKEKPKKALEPNLREMEEQLRTACGTKVEIVESAPGKGGRITIEFYNADDLERIAGFFIQA